MGVHIQPEVSDFKIYFYDKKGGAELYDDKEPYRAIMTGAIKYGADKGVMLSGLCGRLEAGDTEELAAKLKAHGFDEAWCEVRKDVKVSRLLTKAEELETTNIYYCDLREVCHGSDTS